MTRFSLRFSPLLIALCLLPCLFAGSAGAATYYVSNSTANGMAVGIDSATTTQAQSMATPWLTVGHALAACASGDTAIVNTGTYGENNAASGQLYLGGFPFASYVTIQAYTGVATDVTIQGTTNTSSDIFCSGGTPGSYIKFKNLSLTQRSGNTGSIIRFGSGAYHHLYFDHVIFTVAGVSNYQYAVRWQPTAAQATYVHDITFDSCTFQQSGANDAYAFSCTQFQAGDALVTNLTINNCYVRMGAGFAYQMMGISGLTVTNTTSVATNYYGFLTGNDGVASFPCNNVTVANCFFQSMNKHGVLVGGGTSTGTISGCRVDGGTDPALGQGIVLKECSGIAVSDCNVFSGFNSGLYLKAATGCSFTRCVANTVIGNALKVAAGDTGNQNSNNSVTNCQFIAMGNGTSGASTLAFQWPSSGADSGGTVIDYNKYTLLNGAVMSVRGTGNITTLSQLQGAWSTYSVTTNDAHSQFGLTTDKLFSYPTGGAKRRTQ